MRYDARLAATIGVLSLVFGGCTNGGDGAACTPELECPEGRSCVEGSCAPAGDSDGGSDSGVSAYDSGPTDSGASDSGAFDSGATDAGATDSGSDGGACVGGDCEREVISIDGVGQDGVCVLLRSGELWCREAGSSTLALSLFAMVPGGAQVARGLGPTCVRSQTGRVQCVGRGPLGDGTAESSAVLVDVIGLTDAVHIDTWVGHACAARATGGVVCWGDNSLEQIQEGGSTSYLTPHPIPSISDALRVATSRLATCVLRAGGQVSCWSSGFGATPTPVPGITGAIEITAGHFHFCVRTATGAVTCFASPTSSFAPGPPETIADAVEVVAGHSVTCYRSATGAVRCWGVPFMPTPPEPPVLEPVVGLADAVLLGNGCALRSTGALSCRAARDAVVDLPRP